MKNPQSILITGATSGIGEALARAYAKPGVILSLVGRNRERLDKIINECKNLGATVEGVTIDVTAREQLKAWINARDSISPLDLIIANAGVSNAGEVKTEEVEREIFTINLFGVLNTIYPAIAFMRKRKHGQIVIMSSLAAMHGFPRAPAYCASKAAVKVFGESLRNKLRPDGIEVTVVCPGFIKTPMTDVNKFPMPFLMSVDKAAKNIVRDLARNKGLIAFPLRMYLLLWLLRLLPHKLQERIAVYI